MSVKPVITGHTRIATDVIPTAAADDCWSTMEAMDMNRDIVDVRSLQDRVYDRIREAMRKGVFAAEQPLTIRALAQRFGTSEMPVREAIKRLVAERALFQQSDRTFRLPPVTAEHFKEITPIRSMIESYATETAAQLAPADLSDRLAAVNERMVQALSSADVLGILENNQAFHFMIYEAAGNTTLLEVIETLWLRSGPYLALLAGKRRGINAFFDAAESHSRIIAGLQRRDGAAAAAALREDIEITGHWFWAELEAAVPGAPSSKRSPRENGPASAKKEMTSVAKGRAASRRRPAS